MKSIQNQFKINSKLNVIALLLFILPSNLFSQEKCKDIFVTEIVFTKQINTNIIDHSIELFNPTEQDINLSLYKIVLEEANGNLTNISLNGIVPSHGTFVISNINANSTITELSDALNILLSLEGKVVVNLTGPTGDIIDKFGQQGIETTATTIDINELLNNPLYLNGLDINLGSIENLLLRRKPTIQKGKNFFESTDLISEWDIYPNFLIDNLGSHINACLVPVVSWENINFATAEEIVYEQNENFISPIYFVEGLEDVGIEIGVNDLDAVFINSAEYEVAFSGSDYSFIAENKFIEPGVNEFGDYDVATIVNDLQPEEDEVVGFWLDIVDDNGTFAFTADNVYDIIIVDDDAVGIEDHKIESNDVTIFPTISNSIINIKTEDPNLIIEDARILSNNGSNVYNIHYENMSNKINVQSLPSNGYYSLIIKTNEGIIIKKFIKY